jgi:serine/threonine-protein kinase RsbW
VGVAVSEAPDQPLHVRLAAVPGNVPVARRAVTELCVALGVSDDVVSDVRIAVSEACANATLHAYLGREPGDFEVQAERDGEQLRVLVRDFGRGMLPRLDSPGLGVGLPIIASLTSSFEMHGGAGDAPTELVMCFDCAA